MHQDTSGDRGDACVAVMMEEWKGSRAAPVADSASSVSGEGDLASAAHDASLAEADDGEKGGAMGVIAAKVRAASPAFAGMLPRSPRLGASSPVYGAAGLGIMGALEPRELFATHRAAREARKVRGAVDYYLHLCQQYSVKPDAAIISALRVGGNTLKPSRNFSDEDMLPLAELLLWDPPKEEEDSESTGDVGTLPSAQFTTLLLGGCHLYCGGAITLGRILRANTSLEFIDISRNNIAGLGCEHIANALEHNSTVTHLDLHSNSIGLQGARAMAHAIQGTHHSLLFLDLSANLITYNGVVVLRSAVAGCNYKRGHVSDDPPLPGGFFPWRPGVDICKCCSHKKGAVSTKHVELQEFAHADDRKSTKLEADLSSNLVLEELWNSLTHGAGAALAVIATAFNLVRAASQTVRHVEGALIFSLCLLMVYFSSMFYHSFFMLKAPKAVFHRLDRSAIYLLIAGTYTPICMISLYGLVGTLLLASIWAMAFLGVLLDIIAWSKCMTLKYGLYLAMGWALVPWIYSIMTYPGPVLGFWGYFWLAFGGIIYTAGVFFLVNDEVGKFYHVFWHICSLVGSIMHWVCIYYYVLPNPLADPPMDYFSWKNYNATASSFLSSLSS
ncbi:monocyte to macrophage differentiation protein [Pelomyxa schiedti]|nr:monocyte to macrophage differentiation protein [Pelomyxa schiedti]